MLLWNINFFYAKYMALLEKVFSNKLTTHSKWCRVGWMPQFVILQALHDISLACVGFFFSLVIIMALIIAVRHSKRLRKLYRNQNWIQSFIYVFSLSFSSFFLAQYNGRWWDFQSTSITLMINGKCCQSYRLHHLLLSSITWEKAHC